MHAEKPRLSQLMQKALMNGETTLVGPTRHGLEQKCINSQKLTEINNEELDADITVNGVRAIIRGLKNGKSSGNYRHIFPLPVITKVFTPLLREPYAGVG